MKWVTDAPGIISTSTYPEWIEYFMSNEYYNHKVGSLYGRARVGTHDPPSTVPVFLPRNWILV